jgi:hypothetical protein
MLLVASGVQRKFFGQKFDLNMQFGCIAQKLMHYSEITPFQQRRSVCPVVPLSEVLKNDGKCSMQELLGHKEVTTTMIYNHVLNKGRHGMRSPMDGCRFLIQTGAVSLCRFTRTV